MDLHDIARISITVASFATFIGIVAWAVSRKRRPAFATAATAPFALPDEAEHAARAHGEARCGLHGDNLPEPRA